MLYTTLKQIKKCGPCGQEPEPDGSLNGWLKLLSYLGKTYSDDEPLGFDVILESNGLDDALWCLRSVDGYEREMRLLACDYAEHVLPIYEKKYPNDMRPRDCIATSRKYANSEASIEELRAAAYAADAAYAAAYAAYDPHAATYATYAAKAAYAAYAAAYAADAAYAASDAYAAADAAARASDASDAYACKLDWKRKHFIEWLNQIGGEKC